MSSGLDLRFETVAEALYFEAKVAGPQRGITFIGDDGTEQRVTYLDALERAYHRAAALQALGVEPREPVLVVLPTSADFLPVFFGLMFAGAIPCPLAPPVSFGHLAGYAERAAAIARYLGAKRVVAAGELATVLQAAPSLQVIRDAELATGPAPEGFAPVAVGAHDTAFIQCTSGSTGLPKGVMLSHENLISNVYQIGWCLDLREADVVGCWLPLYHDMGLIGCLLLSVYWNLDAVFTSPFRFLKRPATWLQAMAKHGGTVSPAPNFAYGYTARRVQDEDVRALDLSRWRIGICGAEPIHLATLEAFERRLAGAGLPAGIATPSYGLAEATLAVTIHPPGSPRVEDRLDREALAERGEVRDASGGEDGVPVVACGRPLPEMRVRVAGPRDEELPEGRVGRILVKGPTVMRGYYRLPEQTEAALRDGWLDTGDLGYLRGGSLRVTGRAKDIVIIRGKNYVPSDFEWAAERVEGVRLGNVVAFGVTDAGQETEDLVLVLETDVAGDDPRADLRRAVADEVAGRTGIRPAHVDLVARGSLPKTSSGKLMRYQTKQRFLRRRG